MKEIIVTIKPDGSIQVEAVGYKGESCKDATKAIEKALGIVSKETLKPEYYEKELVGEKIKIK